jgi:hypothetical protein
VFPVLFLVLSALADPDTSKQCKNLTSTMDQILERVQAIQSSPTASDRVSTMLAQHATGPIGPKATPVTLPPATPAEDTSESTEDAVAELPI